MPVPIEDVDLNLVDILERIRKFGLEERGSKFDEICLPKKSKAKLKAVNRASSSIRILI